MVELKRQLIDVKNKIIKRDIHDLERQVLKQYIERRNSYPHFKNKHNTNHNYYSNPKAEYLRNIKRNLSDLRALEFCLNKIDDVQMANFVRICFTNMSTLTVAMYQVDGMSDLYLPWDMAYILSSKYLESSQDF